MSVRLCCPSCAYHWLAAILVPSDAVTEQDIAAQCWCVQCEQPPPMRVVTEQLELFA